MAYAVLPQAGVDLGTTSTTQLFPLGIEVNGSDGAIYCYVRASAAVAQYAVCKIDDDLRIAELTTAISGAEPTAVGVAQIAFASGDYGWIVVQGNCTVLVSASCTADTKLLTTATAGVAHSTGTDTIQGLKINTANGGVQAAVAGYAATRMTTNCQD